jgi:hypothetical protein
VRQHIASARGDGFAIRLHIASARGHGLRREDAFLKGSWRVKVYPLYTFIAPKMAETRMVKATTMCQKSPFFKNRLFLAQILYCKLQYKLYSQLGVQNLLKRYLYSPFLLISLSIYTHQTNPLDRPLPQPL